MEIKEADRSEDRSVSMHKDFMDFKKQCYFKYTIRDELKGLNLLL